MESNLNQGKFTKDEVIGVVFSKLNPEKEWTFADIGSGSGRVAEFFSKYVRKVYAVEKDGALIDKLREKFTGTNVEVVAEDGYSFLSNNSPDCVFFGGTSGIERMLEVCEAKRIAVNCARMDVAMETAKKMKELGMFREIVIVNISKSYDLAGGIAFRALNPVFVVVGYADRR